MPFVMYDPFKYSHSPCLFNPEFNSIFEPESPLLPQLARLPPGWRSMSSQRDTRSTITLAGDKFEANLDVQQFKPKEISVKVSGNVVILEGKHKEKEDDHGFISRHFLRKYVLPDGYDIDRIESKLSSDGVLTITAPKLYENKEEQRDIPVIQTGQPSQAVEQKHEELEE